MVKHHFKRLEHLDTLIGKKATGSPGSLARKMNVSIRTVYVYIDILKSLDAPIAYDKHRESYYYEEKGYFRFHFIKEF